MNGHHSIRALPHGSPASDRSLAWVTYAPLGLDLLEAVDRGILTHVHFALLAFLTLDAHRSGGSGVVWTSQAVLRARLQGIGLTSVRTALAELRNAGFLKIFHRQGCNGSYAVALHGFIVNLRGQQYRLDAHATDDPMRPTWRLCERVDGPFSAPSAALPSASPSTSPTASPAETTGGADGGRPSPHPYVVDETRELRRGSAATVGMKRANPDGTSRHCERVVDALVDHWRALATTKGQHAEVRYGPHRQAFVKLLALVAGDLDAAQAVVTAFFDDCNPYIKSLGWSVKAFETRMRGYLAQRAPQPTFVSAHPPKNGGPEGPPATPAFLADLTARRSTRAVGGQGDR